MSVMSEVTKVGCRPAEGDSLDSFAFPSSRVPGRLSTVPAAQERGVAGVMVDAEAGTADPNVGLTPYSG